MRKSIVYAGLILILIAAGCGKRAVIRKYYVLQPDVNKQMALDLEKPFPKALEVRDFQVARAFEQSRIAFRSASHEMNYYWYHHWASRPSTGITYMVFQMIDGAGIFEKTSLGFATHSDFIITGDVHQLERVEQEEENKTSAHLCLTLKLLNASTGQEIMRYPFDRQIVLKDGSMNRFAESVSHILQQETQTFIKQVVRYMKEMDIS